MIISGVGFSENVSDARAAGAEAMRRAMEELNGEEPAIVFAFSSIRYNQEAVLAGVHDAAPEATQVVGASAAGEILTDDTLFKAVNVVAIASDQMQFATGIGRNAAGDSFTAGAEAAQSVIDNAGGEHPELFIMLPDGLAGNGAQIVEGVQSVLGKNFPIIGGAAGDDYQFNETYEYYDGNVETDAVVGVGVYGTFAFGFGIRHGWQPVGLSMEVTKAEGTVIKEIDDRPALQVYEEYFGKEASELVQEPLARLAYTYPFGLEVEGSDELLLRDPIKANEAGEITMAASVPEGSMVRLMIGDRDKAIDAAQTAARIAVEQLEGATPRAVLMFNCMARNKLLGARCHEENQTVRSVIGSDVPMGGYYTYGEQGPLLGTKGTPAYFHNETMTLLVIGE